MKNFLWFILGLVIASGVVVAQNLTLTETLLTSLNTSATNATRKTQVVDGSGNVIAATSNALNVNVNNATALGQAVMASSSPVVIASNQSAVPVSLSVSATGGATISSAIAPATPAGVNLKASAGTVYSVNVTTVQATPIYVKLYNASSAPTCGSGTPVARFMVPSNATAADGAGTNISFPVGLAFGTGIGYCVTGALADNDTTAITATNTLVNISWN